MKIFACPWHLWYVAVVCVEGWVSYARQEIQKKKKEMKKYLTM